VAEEVLRAKIIIDVKDAISAYTEARQHHVSMVTALNTGAGALMATGVAIAGVGVGIAAGLLVAVNAASEFERKLDFFGAVADASVKDMERIRAKALELGADSIYSADQVADSFTTLAKAGVNAQEVLAGVGEAVIALGAAADIPLADAASSLTTILNTFNIAAEDSVAVVDKLAGAANSSNIDVQDLILTMTYAGSSAAVAGISFEDLNTAIAVLGEAGIKGSKAGTGLRQMIDKLIAPTNAGKEALSELGIITEELGNQLLTAEGKMKPLPEVLDIINGATQNLNAAEKIDILGRIFPITSLPTILNLLQGGSAAMAELNKEINKTTAADVAAARLNNLSGDVEYLRGELQTLVINIGATQQALARGLVQAIEKVVTWLNQLSPAALGALVLMAQIAAVVLILFGGLAILSGGILKIISLFIVLRDVAILAKIFTAVVAGVGRLGAALLTFPGIAIVAVLALLVAGLIAFFTKTEEGKQLLTDIGVIFSNAFASMKPAIDSIVASFNQLIAALAPVIAMLIGGVAAGLVAITPAILLLAEIIANVLVAGVTVLAEVLRFISDILSGPFGGVLLVIVGIIAAVVVAIKIWVAVQWLLNIALTANPIGAIIMAIVLLVAAIIWVATQTTFFQDLWANLASFFTTIWTAVVTSFTTAWSQIVTFFTGIWNAIVAFLTPILTFIYGLIKFYVEMYINIFLILAAILVTIWQAIVAAVTWAWELIWSIIGPIVEQIVSFITDSIMILQVVWSVVWTAISNFFSDIWNGMVQFFIPIILSIMSFVISTVSTIQGVWNSIWSAISSFFSGIWNGMVGAVSGPVNQIFSIIGGIQGTIMGFFSGIGSWLVGVGRDLIMGMVNGVKNAASALINAVGDVVNGAIDWAKGVLGMASPSKVFRAIGIDTIRGMIVGVEKTAPALNRTMEVVASGVESLYDQVYAAREMDVMLNLQSQMGVDAYSAAQANQLALLNEKLQEIADKETFNIEKLEVNNGEAQQDIEDALPDAIRKTSYLVG